MTKPQFKLTALAASLLFALTLCAPAQAQEAGAARKSANEAAAPEPIYSVPEGWFAIRDSQLGPTMLLNPKKPAGMFVIYPKQGETAEAARARLREAAAKMFFHDDTVALEWQVKTIQPHPGDGKGVADIATTRQGDMEVQVVTYERAAAAPPFLYGYFAMRGKKSSASFVDESGKGVKDFDKLWKSFAN
jgi:hypothetical protein